MTFTWLFKYVYYDTAAFIPSSTQSQLPHGSQAGGTFKGLSATKWSVGKDFHGLIRTLRLSWIVKHD